MSIFSISLHGSVIIAAILIIRHFALDKLPKKAFIMLWDIAMLRLVIPLSLSSRLSVYNLASVFKKQPEQISQTQTAFKGTANIVSGGSAYYNYNALPEMAEKSSEIPIWLIVYLLGAAICLLFFVVSYIMLLRSFRFSLPCDNSYVGEFIGRQRLIRRVHVRCCGSAISPLTYGILRPTILLPKSMTSADNSTLAYILDHELTHIKRWDNLRKFFAAVVLSIHWFNPAVWLLYFVCNRDIELCCDEAVVRKNGLDRRSDYAAALIALAEKVSGFSSLTSHFNGNSAEERINSIMKTKKTTIFTSAIAAAIILTMTATLCTSATEIPKTDPVHHNLNGYAADYDNVRSVINDVIIVGNIDGTAYYSTDGVGFQKCPADFFTGCTDDIEWWSYEEYKEWLENEKVALQSLLGEKAWTQHDGDFIWTQEKINEAIAMYEKELEMIKNGVMISRPKEDGTQYMSSGTDSFFTSVYDDYCQSTASCGVSIKTILDIFGKYGITADHNGELYYKEEKIRYFTDCVEIGDGGIATKLDYYRQDGTVNVRTVRRPITNGDGSIDPFGELIGLEKADETVIPPQDCTVDCVTECYKSDSHHSKHESKHHTDHHEHANAYGCSNTTGTSFEEIFSKYAQYGITYKASNDGSLGNVYLNGKPVISFADIAPNGSAFSYTSRDGGDISVIAVYNGSGKLCGVKTA